MEILLKKNHFHLTINNSYNIKKNNKLILQIHFLVKKRVKHH